MMYCNEWVMYVEKFISSLRYTALKLDKLLHANCKLTFSSVQYTVNYVQLSSTMELSASYLQNINQPVQCN